MQGNHWSASGDTQMAASTTSWPLALFWCVPEVSLLWSCLHGGRCPGWLPKSTYTDHLGQGPSDPSLEGFPPT